MPPAVHHIDTTASRYNFDALKHGDVLWVQSKAGAQEMFRRWKKAKGRPRSRLIPSHEFENLLIFLDEVIV